MNCGNLYLCRDKDEYLGFRKSEILGGTGGLALGTVSSALGGDIVSILAGLGTTIAANSGGGNIDKAECGKTLNALSSLGKSLAAVGAANLILPGSNFFLVLLAALGIVVVADTVYYVGKRVASKVSNILKNSPKQEDSHTVAQSEAHVEIEDAGDNQREHNTNEQAPKSAHSENEENNQKTSENTTTNIHNFSGPVTVNINSPS